MYYKLTDEVHDQIVEMADCTDRSMRSVVELAVKQLYAGFDAARREGDLEPTFAPVRRRSP